MPAAGSMAFLAYLGGAVLFILALKGLTTPATSRRGNWLGMIGMGVAVGTTLLVAQRPAWALLAVALAAGAVIGTGVARRVQMTQMPELVAAMHALVGLAAVLIAAAIVLRPHDAPTTAQRIELFLGAAIGAVTFSASVIAWAKLSAKLSGKPLAFAGQHWLNLLLALTVLGCGVTYWLTDSAPFFMAMVALATLLGILLIMPIGGADMPVVVSLLNSYSGWAAAGIGFSLDNPILIIAGACVGASGAILSMIMCRAMNRSLVSVLLGGFGAAQGEAATAAGASQRPVKSGSPEDALFLLKNAERVIVVPGYGLAVSRAQHALQEFAELLRAGGVDVKYAIHPVAGRMPGHMNVLLAEAEVPYDQVFEQEEINNDFAQTDVVIVLGANDVVNPAARNNPESPIYGMPILEAHRARTVIVVKRSMAAGYAGLDNDLFYLDKTMMVFGDAKKVIEEMVKNFH
ncbi:MAG TPA: NAD(P)(+) transhydrogenase (Re/Si-specific) subunit beta [Rhodocyclaceae bacterium]|nr:NAD(P)(+) transhydrogenase (Re/Si-specific) subunit beta [Rhodocyclaceae bacterium]